MNPRDQPLTLYNGSAEHDLAVMHWWAVLNGTGEAEKTFMPNTYESMSKFYKLFKLPSFLTFKFDEGIWFASWYEPVMAGGFLGIWAAKDKRQSRAMLIAVEDAISFGLDRFPVLIGLTRQKDILDEHCCMGYRVLGNIPELWAGGKDCWVVSINREQFNARRIHSVKRPETVTEVRKEA